MADFVKFCLVTIDSFFSSPFVAFIYVVYGHMGFPSGSVVKNPPANAGDLGLILGSRRSPEEEMATYPNILAWNVP